MYHDIEQKELDREGAAENWSDEIKSFVPSFSPVKVTQIGDRSLDAHIVLTENGEAAIRLIDAGETITYTFPLAKLFDFDHTQFDLESWEMFFGLLEIQRQIAEIKALYDSRVEMARKIMNLRPDQPPAKQEEY